MNELDGRVIAALKPKRDDQTFLRNLFHASELPLPRTLLSDSQKASGLSDEQLSVINEMADGVPLADAAREAQVLRGRIEGWIAGDPRFRRVLDQLRRDEVEDNAQNLQLLRAPALKALRTLLDSPTTPPDILGRLALAILDRTGQPIDLVEHWGDFPALSQTPAPTR